MLNVNYYQKHQEIIIFIVQVFLFLPDWISQMFSYQIVSEVEALSIVLVKCLLPNNIS